MACSTAAEFERPEDTSVLRASYTKAGFIAKALTGSTDICQITSLEAEGGTQILKNYGVVLDEEGCAIAPLKILLGD